MTAESVASRSGRVVVMAYAVLAYATFLVATLWAIGFLSDWPIVHTIDGSPTRSLWLAVPVDVGLLLLFALQHSVMARDGVKQRLERLVPSSAERSTYVFAASVVLVLVFGEWQSLPASIWRVDVSPWTGAIWVAYGIGWLITIAATFMVDHWDFLGLRQAMSYVRRLHYAPPSFTARWLYAWIRHPMMLGLVIVFWATPYMTVGHLLFAGGMTAYIAVGIRFEERGLRKQLGSEYRDYAARVPAIVPRRHVGAFRPSRRPPAADPCRSDA